MCKPSYPPADEIILVTSNGDSADYFGNSMGLYQLMEEQFNNAPVYKQLHNKSRGDYIYLGDDGLWFVGKDLGDILTLNEVLETSTIQ